jgi:dipeptidyl aminopeptidase/acylaminoacyl peptidase
VSLIVMGAVSVLAGNGNADTDGYAKALSIYNSIFVRYQSVEPQIRTIDEFKGLEVQERSFLSDRGQKLAGYIYSKKGLPPVGVVIIAHGLGVGGQCVYMAAADYFASHGYLVFAYDATGNDKSEGASGVGMEQGIIDLSQAIDYVEHDSRMRNYPIVLFGHSWGAYCVGAVLNVHPEVKAVVAVSGFNSTQDYFRYVADEEDTDGTLSMLASYVERIEKQKFGKYADYSALSGFANTKAGVMIIHSKDDQNVAESLGYDLYYKKYKDDARFRFKLYENRKHMYIFYTDEAVAYDHQRIDDRTLAPTAYGRSHAFDKSMGYKLDTNLFSNILDFYNAYCLLNR